MSFFTALLDYSGAHNQARAQAQQTAYQNALQQRQMGLDERREAFDERNAGMQNQLLQAQLQQYQRENQQATTNRQFEGGLQLPKGWAGMKPDQRIAYLTQRYNAAQRAGDTELAKSTLDEINSLELGAERLANAQYTTQGKLPLAQAQAGWWRQKHSEVMAALQAKERVADASMRASMGRAQIAARARLASASMSNDEKEYIATLTALNAANRQDANQAFQSAMAQYHTAAAAWQNQERNYQLGIGTDPGAAPNPQSFTINMPQTQPSLMVVPIPLPNGQTINAPAVDPHGGGVHVNVQREVTNIKQAIQAGVPQAKIVQVLQQRMQKGEVSPQDEQAILREVFGHPQ